jgi:solute carrier family 25 oxoglutarate transporter 11
MIYNNILATAPASGTTSVPKSVIFATSGIGGCLGWCVVHPFNTVAVRMNLASAAGRSFTFGDMVKKQGFMSVYDGLSAGILRQVFYATTRFGLFETFRDMLHEYRGKTDFASRYVYACVWNGIYTVYMYTVMLKSSFLFVLRFASSFARSFHTNTNIYSVVVGAMTGGIAAYISCPMEVAVVRMSNDSSLPKEERRNYKNVFDTASRITKEEGVGAFWRGSNPFVIRAMMVGVFQVATLDQFKELYCHHFNQQKNSIPNVFSAAMSSGLVYSIATMPLEAAKNRMASQKPDAATGKLPFTGTFQTLAKVSSEKGFLALYHGFFPYYLRCGGHTVSMFIAVQVLRDYYMAHA